MTQSHSPKRQSIPLTFSYQNFRKTILNIVFVLTICILFIFEDLREIAIAVLSDAFWQVSVYVAITLALYDFLTNKVLMKNHFFTFQRFPLLLSAFLGSLPGCGGAIVVMTKFIQGHLSFGCVVAVLTSTMGDAAFLLLASRPQDGLVIIVTGFVVGIFSGWIVDRIHQENFMVPKHSQIDTKCSDESDEMKNIEKPEWLISKMQNTLWKWILIPSFFISLLGSFQLDANSILRLPTGSIEWIGSCLAIFCMFIWNIDHILHIFANKDTHYNETLKVGKNTNFVLCWVVASFLLFELGIHFTGFDIGLLFEEFQHITPLIAVAIGLLPGCGPQILVTTFYLSDAIPFSAQLGNALSNDGDALFPAIALTPKAAILATIYSAIPAIICAYSYAYFFEIP